MKNGMMLVWLVSFVLAGCTLTDPDSNHNGRDDETNGGGDVSDERLQDDATDDGTTEMDGGNSSADAGTTGSDSGLVEHDAGSPQIVDAGTPVSNDGGLAERDGGQADGGTAPCDPLQGCYYCEADADCPVGEAICGCVDETLYQCTGYQRGCDLQTHLCLSEYTVQQTCEEGTHCDANSGCVQTETSDGGTIGLACETAEDCAGLWCGCGGNTFHCFQFGACGENGYCVLLQQDSGECEEGQECNSGQGCVEVHPTKCQPGTSDFVIDDSCHLCENDDDCPEHPSIGWCSNGDQTWRTDFTGQCGGDGLCEREDYLEGFAIACRSCENDDDCQDDAEECLCNNLGNYICGSYTGVCRDVGTCQVNHEITECGSPGQCNAAGCTETTDGGLASDGGLAERDGGTP